MEIILAELAKKRIGNFYLTNRKEKEIESFFSINKENPNTYERQILSSKETHLYWENIRFDFEKEHLFRCTFSLRSDSKYKFLIDEVGDESMYLNKGIKLHSFLYELNQKKIEWIIDEFKTFNDDYLILKVGAVKVYFYLFSGEAVKVICQLG